ncbi:flagellar biosynthesis regulator FlaF [Roseinatronobacter alkalisoli]|uniref:Flagellar biosynthesis regulator FlaF n=1 Tax=Roseinatronobacter alkalisoli TaxID=3028235 RepID=A0ABT5TBG4_9RHOB|nr:flagellar biosynthesis regulator FlaF [Roseinatronobacter sp. HJB301]MDD7971731.1 flagellar biosynthesis regulator FlaF [Roseinatronobacter sp. HJB301]
MNAHVMAAAAYGVPNTAYKTPRLIEYELISRITSRMRSAIKAQPFIFAALAEAMHENRRLWVELAIDLATPGNQLPDSLRLQLLGLAQFSLRHTDQVLDGRENAEVLVDINLAVMRGLAGKAETT